MYSCWINTFRKSWSKARALPRSCWIDPSRRIKYCIRTCSLVDCLLSSISHKEGWYVRSDEDEDDEGKNCTMLHIKRPCALLVALQSNLIDANAHQLDQCHIHLALCFIQFALAQVFYNVVFCFEDLDLVQSSRAGSPAIVFQEMVLKVPPNEHC